MLLISNLILLMAVFTAVQFPTVPPPPPPTATPEGYVAPPTATPRPTLAPTMTRTPTTTPTAAPTKTPTAMPTPMPTWTPDPRWPTPEPVVITLQDSSATAVPLPSWHWFLLALALGTVALFLSLDGETWWRILAALWGGVLLAGSVFVGGALGLLLLHIFGYSWWGWLITGLVLVLLARLGWLGLAHG